MFKRLLALLLAAVALFSFSSCKKSEPVVETVDIAEEINESAAHEVIECPNDNMIGLEKIVIFEDHVVVVLDKQICDDLEYDENKWVGNANNYTLERYLDEEDPKFRVHFTNYRSTSSSSIEVINDKYVATIAFGKIDFRLENSDEGFKIYGVRVGDFEIDFDEEKIELEYTATGCDIMCFYTQVYDRSAKTWGSVDERVVGYETQPDPYYYVEPSDETDATETEATETDQDTLENIYDVI